MSWISDGSEVIRAWPHRVGIPSRADILEVVMEVTLRKSGDEVHKVEARNFRPNRRRNHAVISLHEEFEEDSYDELELDFKVSTLDHDEHMAYVTHPGDDGYRGTHFIQVRSNNTRRWFHTPLVDATDHPEYNTRVRIHKSEVSGALSILPFIVLSEDLGDEPQENYARAFGSILAGGCDMQIQIDRPSAITGGSINPQWQSFKKDGWGNALFRPHIEEQDSGAPEIIFFWNNDHGGELKRIIDYDKRNKTPVAKKRDGIYSFAAPELSYFLCEWASGRYDFDNDGFDAENASDELAESILTHYSRMLKMPPNEIASAFRERDHHELEEIRANFQHHWNTGKLGLAAMGVIG